MALGVPFPHPSGPGCMGWVSEKDSAIVSVCLRKQEDSFVPGKKSVQIPSCKLSVRTLLLALNIFKLRNTFSCVNTQAALFRSAWYACPRVCDGKGGTGKRALRHTCVCARVHVCTYVRVTHGVTVSMVGVASRGKG